MKKNILKPVVMMTVSTFVLYGCASTEENTTAMEDTSISKTETMAGNVTDNDGVSVLVIEEQVTVPIATLSATALMMENPEEIDQMFENIDDTEQYDVLELAKSSPNLSTFVQLIEQAQLKDDMQRVEKLTLFAPTNEAFAKLPKRDLENLLMGDNFAALTRLMQNHVLSSEVSSSQLKDNDRIEITEDKYILIDSDSDVGATRIGGAQIIKNDIKASNGTIHVIDAIITPTTNTSISR